MWEKATTFHGEFDAESFEELPTVVHWGRQAYGLLMGIVIGATGVTGPLGFLLFFGLSVVLVQTYVRGYLDVDPEEFPGIYYTEGMMPSFGLFVTSWTITYTLCL